MTNILLATVAAWAGERIPIPYTFRMDEVVTILLLGCFFLSAYVLSRSRNYLLQLGHDFLLHRERASIFSDSTGGDMRHLLLLVGQTCVLIGLYLFICFGTSQPALLGAQPTWKLVGVYAGICGGYVFLKWMLYFFLGWIFLDRETTGRWMEAYSTLLYYLGFALFLSILFIVYFNSEFEIMVIVGIVLFLFLKILAFYKWLKLFCSNLYGSLFLILYFCAVEIIPCLMVYRGLVELNDYLIINY